MDFLKCLEKDMVLNIFNRLDDPADLVRASNVSRDWLDFVISSELCKQLCLRQFPQAANVADVNETKSRSPIEFVEDSTEVEDERELLSRNHRVYGALLHTIQMVKSSPSINGDCVKEKFRAFNYQSPDDYIIIPEKLIFKLEYDTCVVTEIDISPYRVDTQEKNLEKEDYSAKSVRFRMGFHNLDQFIWTYTSPEFPMNPKCSKFPWGATGQQFKLPEPVLCTGGFVMVELLGRVQMDHKRSSSYYIDIKTVNVLGRPLSPAFDAEVKDHSGKFGLSYDSGRLGQTLQWQPQEKSYGESDSEDDMCACGCSHNIESD